MDLQVAKIYLFNFSINMTQASNLVGDLGSGSGKSGGAFGLLEAAREEEYLSKLVCACAALSYVSFFLIS